MCEAVTVAAAVANTLMAVQADRTNKAVANANAENAELQAQDALKRGEEARIEARRRGSILEGAQRAALSSRGLDISEGTAADTLTQTEFFTQSDEATARTNARREAWDRRAQRNSYRAQADAIQPGLTLLAGAGNVASKWNQYNNPPKPGKS